MLGVVGISTISALRTDCAARASVSKVCTGKNGRQEDLEDKADVGTVDAEVEELDWFASRVCTKFSSMNLYRVLPALSGSRSPPRRE